MLPTLRPASAALFALLLTGVSGIASAVPIVRSIGGDDTSASIQATVDQFRADLGEPNNGNAPGPLPEGRREINWDGGGNDAPATVFPTPFENFNTPPTTRGAEFITPGTGFEISGQPSPEFGEINPTYPDTFNVFSSPRLFSPLGSVLTDVLFFIPGTDTRASVSGFGAVFTDVDLAEVSAMELFDVNNMSLGSFFVPAGTVADESLSFLGISFDDPIISRVRITSGNTALGPDDDPDAGIDVVVMDDFLYGEPQALQVVSEPPLALLFAFGALGLLGWRRCRSGSAV